MPESGRRQRPRGVEAVLFPPVCQINFRTAEAVISITQMLRIALAWIATVVLAFVFFGALGLGVVAYRHPEFGLRPYVVALSMSCGLLAPLVGGLWTRTRSPMPEASA